MAVFLLSGSVEESFNPRSFANEKKRESTDSLLVAAPKRPGVPRVATSAIMVRDFIWRMYTWLPLFLGA